MAHHQVPDSIERRYLEPSARGRAAVAGLVVVGLVALVYRLIEDPRGAWISYVSNWLFFTSVAMGSVLLAVVTWVVKAKWNWPMRRISQAAVAFLPISFLLLVPMLLFLGENYFPWIAMMADDHIVQNKAAYLNRPFLVARNAVGALLLFGMAVYFVWHAVRPDLGSDTDPSEGSGREAARRSFWRRELTRGWMGQAEEEAVSYRRMTVLGPAIILVYAVVMSIFSYDWAMSLEPHWFSTMFGPWFFMGAFWTGVASTALWSLHLRTRDPYLSREIGLQQRHDIGKLAFAFCVFWTYLFFSQYLVIWYAKLPWEQAWIVRRSYPESWGPFSLAVLACCFLIPFVGLIGRKSKRVPGLLAFFCVVALVGIWLERYGLVAPSLWHEGDPIFTIWHPAIGCLFLGLYLWAVRWFLRTFPAVQLWQPQPDPEPLEAELHAPAPAGAEG